MQGWPRVVVPARVAGWAWRAAAAFPGCAAAFLGAVDLTAAMVAGGELGPADGAGSGFSGSGVRCVCNLSPVPVDLPGHTGVLLASGPLAGGQLPPETAVWLRPAAGRQ